MMNRGVSAFRTAKRHFWDSVPSVIGQDAWLCWPATWEPITYLPLRIDVMSAVLVTDRGHIVWGRTGERDWVPHLRDRRAPLRRTDPGRTVTTAPRPSRCDGARTHRRLLGVLVLVLLPVLTLTGAVSGRVAAIGVTVFALLHLWGIRRFPVYEGPGHAWMTIREDDEEIVG
ncbi:hypothetical protein ACFYT4_35775 [Streptomyces sp. NPDC004609]|uniref:hypothetical protein n=1 Tax=Streptomyces sp. NPDC004609 TaxID=3364704 RepID=UPI003699AFF3